MIKIQAYKTVRFCKLFLWKKTGRYGIILLEIEKNCIRKERDYGYCIKH